MHMSPQCISTSRLKNAKELNVHVTQVGENEMSSRYIWGMLHN